MSQPRKRCITLGAEGFETSFPAPGETSSGTLLLLDPLQLHDVIPTITGNERQKKVAY
jgi:hypothetical protein